MKEQVISEWERGKYRLLVFTVWVISFTGSLASLFFSEVMRLPPCSLCWYQRVALFPLVAIFTIGILSGDLRMERYAWPFVVLGFGIALYHNLLTLGVISEGLTPCTQGVSCKSQPIEWLGFVTIPFLSLLTFTAIGSCLIAIHVAKRKQK